MSLIYGAWRLGSSDEAREDCALLGRSFDGARCDASGEAAVGDAAFGCRLFRLYPESRDEIQPIGDAAQRILLAADCRLDNRDDLARVLGLDAVDARATPDSGLILAAYRRWGTDCLRRLEGDFAIALWDEESRQLLLARDVTGVRPLAYATWNGGVAFCSSVPTLYRLPATSPALDDIALAAMLGGHGLGRERTVFSAIRWVPPGELVRIGESGVLKETFARIEPAALSREERRDPARRLGELLEQSVRKRLRGEMNVACELSGGFDSGTVTALAARALQNSGRSLRAISWAPDPALHPLRDGPDERRQILWMEKRYGVPCSFLPYHDSGERPGEDLFEASFRRRAASALRGARVILSGWGGDECASFYLRPFHPHAVFWGGARVAARRLWGEIGATRFGYGAPARLARGIAGAWKERRRRAAFEVDRSSIVNPQLLPEWREALAACHGDEILADASPRCVQSCMMRHLTRGHLEFRAARECLDAARASAEMAYPFQDARLLSFVLSIDPIWFDYGSIRRRLFRSALRSLSVDLAPETRKPEEALVTFSQRRFEVPPEFAEAMEETRTKFLGERIIGPPLREFQQWRVCGAIAHFMLKPESDGALLPKSTELCAEVDN